MKLSKYIQNNLHKKHPTLRLSKPFIEPTLEEMEALYKHLDLRSEECFATPLNPLERFGLDLVLGSVGIDTDNKKQVAELMVYLAQN